MYRNSPPSLLVSICVEFIWFVQPRGKIFSLSLKCLKKAHKSLYSLEWLIIIKKFVCELILVSLCCFSSIYFCFKQYDTNFFLCFKKSSHPRDGCCLSSMLERNNYFSPAHRTVIWMVAPRCHSRTHHCIHCPKSAICLL